MKNLPSRWKYGLVAVLAVLGISSAASYYAGASHPLVAQPKTNQTTSIEEQVKGATAPTATPEAQKNNSLAMASTSSEFTKEDISNVYSQNSNSKEFIQDLLYALDNYYSASFGGDLNSKGSFEEQIIDMMTILKKKNSNILTGNKYLETYSKSDDEIINIAVNGSLAGAQKLIDSNDKLYNFLKHLDTSNADNVSIRSTVVEYKSEQNEGYKLITISAPQVGHLIFAPAENENPTGKIPYKISSTDRKEIIDQIDRSFGDNLYKKDKNGDKNSIIFAVENIRSYLVPETYEEARTQQRN